MSIGSLLATSLFFTGVSAIAQGAERVGITGAHVSCFNQFHSDKHPDHFRVSFIRGVRPLHNYECNLFVVRGMRTVTPLVKVALGDLKTWGAVAGTFAYPQLLQFTLSPGSLFDKPLSSVLGVYHGVAANLTCGGGRECVLLRNRHGAVMRESAMTEGHGAGLSYAQISVFPVDNSDRRWSNLILTDGSY